MSNFDWGERLPTLAGPRVTLRSLTGADVDAVYEVFRDPRVMRYWSCPAYQDRREAEALVRQIHELFAARSLFQWGIAALDNDTVLGTCTLFHLDNDHRRAEIGFALGADHWGRGLATEAIELLIHFAFETLDLHRLEADVDPRNERSLRALERQGFQREGLLRQRYQVGGEIQDAVLLGLLRPEWNRQAHGV